ncbi:MAG: hypothetical protein JW860_13295 [Sedimentisphaerales bacterium]|nr:hypothetical protein [Sedimentisphaerales bacterium]
MYNKKISKGITTAVVILLLCTYTNMEAGYLKFNTHFKNTTGSMVNDYHVRLVANEPITVSSTWQSGGDVQFSPGVVTGNGTKSIEVNWSGATVNQGQTAHCGVSTSTYIPSLTVTESWWTVGGVKFNPNLNDGLMGNADFDGGSDYTVARIKLYDDIYGSNLIGTEWIEGPGDLLGISNLSHDGPLYASVATLSSSTEIALEDLNPSLEGFGPDGPIIELLPAWVRYECEDAELSGDLDIYDPCNPGIIPGWSGRGYVRLHNPSGNLGKIRISVNVREARAYDMRYGVAVDSKTEKWDNWYVNDENGPGPEGQYCREQYACDYEWALEQEESPHAWPDLSQWQEFVDSIIPYGPGPRFWQIVSRWAPSWNDAGQAMNTPMTVELESGYNQIWIEAGWGWASYDFIGLALPPAPRYEVPLDRSLVNVALSPIALEWVNAAQNLDKVEVYFGAVAEPNLITESNYKMILSLIDTINDPTDPPGTDSTSGIAIVDGTTYVWVVDGFRDVDPPGTDPNYGGIFWSFTANDNSPPEADAGEDQHVWQYMQDPCTAAVVVQLDATGSSDDGLPDPPGELNCQWVQTAGPTVFIENSNTGTPTVTLEELASNNEEGSADPYVFRVTVSDGEYADSDSVVVTLTSNSCLASHEVADSFYHFGDINQDCIVDLDDFYEVAVNWIQCTNTLEPDACGD